MDKKKEKEQLELERRNARHKRRIRNQILAYLTVVLVILALAAGIVFGIGSLRKAASKPSKEEEQEQLEQLFSEEETLEQPEEASSETIAELTPEQKRDEIIDAAIETMELKDKVAGLFLVTPESITGVSTAVKAGEGTKKALSEYAVGGIVYGTRNINSEAQIKEMISNTKSYNYSGFPMFMAIEDEGGSASPLEGKGLVAKQDGAPAIAQGGDAQKAYDVGNNIGTYLKDYGFNLNLAPAAEWSAVNNSIMAKRSYGADPAQAGSFVANMVLGLKAGNVSTCLKYFPGQGSATSDPAAGKAATDRRAEDFSAQEFSVFQAGIDAGADMVMMSNITVHALDESDVPSTFSSAIVTGKLRKELDFDGVILSAPLNEKAITEYYGADEAAVMALRAGCDMLYMPEDFEKAYNGVLKAVEEGTIDEERINDCLKRVYRVKYSFREG